MAASHELTFALLSAFLFMLTNSFSSIYHLSSFLSYFSSFHFFYVCLFRPVFCLIILLLFLFSVHFSSCYIVLVLTFNPLSFFLSFPHLSFAIAFTSYTLFLVSCLLSFSLFLELLLCLCHPLAAKAFILQRIIFSSAPLLSYFCCHNICCFFALILSLDCFDLVLRLFLSLSLFSSLYHPLSHNLSLSLSHSQTTFGNSRWFLGTSRPSTLDPFSILIHSQHANRQ